MRGLAICLALAMVALPLWASAQQQEQAPGQRVIVRTPPDYRGLSPDDLNALCFWAGQPYSVGSAFCSRQQTLTTCTAVSGERPKWISKDNDKLCDRNPSLTPQ